MQSELNSTETEDGEFFKTWSGGTDDRPSVFVNRPYPRKSKLSFTFGIFIYFWDSRDFTTLNRRVRLLFSHTD